MTCGTDNHAGAASRADFDRVMNWITSHGMIPWLKMVPIAGSDSVINGVRQDLFCPPWTGAADQNLPMYKSIADELRATGYSGPVVFEMNNESQYACATGVWGQPNSGALGVAKRIGEHYAQTGPQLKAYAQGLGFSEVVVGDEMGESFGAAWGSPTTCTADVSKAFGWSCGYQPRTVDEFNTAVHDAGQPAPDFVSAHFYLHAPAFYSGAPYESSLGDPASAADDDNYIYAYVRNWAVQTRAHLNTVWGATAGNQVRLSISEYGLGASNSGGTWSGWTTPGRPGQFLNGWLSMLRGNGVLTGPSGTAYWQATLFCDACNSDTSTDKYYNYIRKDGTLTGWYGNFLAFTP
jgi:hypothetical protein